MNSNSYEVVIIGGSFAGLSAALCLGRSMRKILVIDNNKPANRYVIAAHNLLTQDGEDPEVLLTKAKKDVEKYSCITRLQENIVGIRNNTGCETKFEIIDSSGVSYTSQKILLATGLKDIMPNIAGFAECWGVSIAHCPYCHGYEHRNLKTGILVDGKFSLAFVPNIIRWTKHVVIFTNNSDILKKADINLLKNKGVKVVEAKIECFIHTDAQIQAVKTDEGIEYIDYLYARPKTSQHNNIAKELGCIIDDEGRLTIDDNYETNIKNVYAAGDNSYSGRSLAQSIAHGSSAAIHINSSLLEDEFSLES